MPRHPRPERSLGHLDAWRFVVLYCLGDYDDSNTYSRMSRQQRARMCMDDVGHEFLLLREGELRYEEFWDLRPG